MGGTPSIGLIGFATGTALVGMALAGMVPSGIALVGAALVAGGPVGAVQRPTLTPVTAGEWQLSEIDGPARVNVCIGDVGDLIPLRPGSGGCTRFVLDGDRASLTVRYTCGGTGHGRSVLTVRSAHSIKLETQGVAGGLPFAADYDGRRVGPCPRP